MKKLMIAMTLALASMIAMPSFAQTADNGAVQTEQTGKQKKDKKKGDKKKCDKKKCDKKGKQCKKGEQKCGQKQGCKGGKCPFEALNLTAEQKEKVQKLGQERQASMDKVKTEAQEKCADVQKKYDEKLQKILTPEQYAQYKAEMDKKGPRGPRDGQGKGFEGRKFEKRGDKPCCNARPDSCKLQAPCKVAQ